ncbi:MAG TPA: FUSC family protein [Baekduia sp.]|jgi:uncharacterized membrane protein YccC|nr:FUSC family protein [Baekduia sp.]
MTSAPSTTAAPAAAAGPPRRRRTVPGLDWLRQHDPGYAALRRAARTALVMPAAFAFADQVIGNPTVATFAAFGSFAMLLLVDFTGPMRDRLRAQALLAVACGVLISLATLVSGTTWLAATTMAVVAFGVLFAGVVSSVLAGATTTLLLAFILPVSLAGTVASIPDRLAGWGLAAGASLLAIALLWPAPSRDPVRSAAIAACRALSARLRAEVDYVLCGGTGLSEAEHDAAIARADTAVGALHAAFFATPYRPTGLSTAARAVVRLVDELRWLNDIVVQAMPQPHPVHVDARACAVKAAAASSLEAAADLLDRPTRSPAALHAALDRMSATLAELEHATTTWLPEDGPTPAAEGPAQMRRIVSSLDPSFRAQELSFVVAQVGRNIDLAAAAERRSWIDRVLGRQPPGLAGPLSAAQERASAHVEPHSQWLRNSLRGGAALGLSVLVADLSSVQHGFWVVFGTLAVLRSNALSTGQNVVRGLVGTAVGFAIGSLLVTLVGTDTTLLWVLLPPAVLFAGLAPAAISFAAGQAAFTLTLLILFNLLQPAGWRLGLLRVEDVALGGAVSLAVGVLFWPRGAAAALGDALSKAYADSASYLAQAVAFGIGRCDAVAPSRPAPTDEAIRAAAASRRLDDTFRGYVAERGSKPMPLAEVTSLVTGVVGLRLAADAVLELWQGDDGAGGDRAEARRQLVAGSELMTGWYHDFAASLAGRGPVPEPLAADALADGKLVAAVSRDLRGADGQATATAVRMIWTGDHLDAARRLQDSLVGPARAAAQQRALM